MNYGVSVAYRDFSAVHTAKLGGVASLVRSVASFSIHSPHTGWQVWANFVLTERISISYVTSVTDILPSSAKQKYDMLSNSFSLSSSMELDLVTMVKWLDCRTCNHKVVGSNPPANR